MLHFRSVSTNIAIDVSQNGSILMNAYPVDLNNNFKDVIEISVGPRDNYDGVKSCLTYNPPGDSKPGYQMDRAVSVLSQMVCYATEVQTTIYS